MDDEGFMIDGKNLSDLRVVDIKELLEKRGLSKTGSKNVLIQRLKEHMKAQTVAEPVYQTSDSQVSQSLEHRVQNPMIAEYLEKQQQALLAAKKAAVTVCSASETEDVSGKISAKLETIRNGTQLNAIDTAEYDVTAVSEVSKTCEPLAEKELVQEDKPEKPSDTVQFSKSTEEPEEDQNTVEMEKFDEILQKNLTKKSIFVGQEVTTVSGQMTKPTSDENKQEKVAEKTEKPQRKRRWGTTTVGKRATVSISSDSLKEIVGDVEAAEVHEEEQPIEIDTFLKKLTTVTETSTPRPQRIVVPREEAPRESKNGLQQQRHESAEVQEDSSVIVRKSSFNEPMLIDEGFIRERPPSPARRPISSIIHVRCLTRPFTVKLLQDFLSKFGPLVKEDFWIDNIKSHCFVKYEKEEDAVEARKQLDNIRWPVTNPSCLHVDFADQSDIIRYRNMTFSKENNRPNNISVTANYQRGVDGGMKPVERTVREVVTLDAKDQRKLTSSREWDVGKDRSAHTTLPSREKTVSKRRTRSPSLPVVRKSSPSTKKERPEEELKGSVKLLEDLFRKTKTMPHIYWLPLTAEQIAQKEKDFGKDQKARERAERVRRLESEERRMKNRHWRPMSPPRDRSRRRH